MTNEERIQHKARVVSFLSDPIVAAALLSLEQENLEDWRNAHLPQAREETWALDTAFRRLKYRLQTTIDNGTFAEIDDERRKRALAGTTGQD